MAKSNIVLIGMPGAGKSTLGVVMAKILRMKFVDADLLIQEDQGKTLQKIIEERGPEGFLQVENQVLASIDMENTVISTGGSAVYSDEAMRHLSEIGDIVYLQISYDVLKTRLGDLVERGVVMRNGMGMSLIDLFDERKPLYEQYAEITVDVENTEIFDAACMVAKAARGYGA